MAGYLDQYGAGDERRERRVSRLLLVIALLLLIGGPLFFYFKDYRQERQVRRFVSLVKAGDFRAAYALWGCTEAKPCRDYPFEKFMEDWGPSSPRAGGMRVKPWMGVFASHACGSGVIATLDLGAGREEKLWVDKSDSTIGFSPWPGCVPDR